MLLVLGLFLLPLLPGLLELWRGRDLAPLSVIAEYDRDIRHFARGFRAYVLEQLDQIGTLTRDTGMVEGRFRDGTPFLLVHDAITGPPPLRSGRLEPLSQVLVVQSPLTLPTEMLATAEVYATVPIDGQRAVVYRALLGESDVWLGEESVVLRWIHSEADLRVGPRSRVFGRASAEGTLRLGEGCRFERIQAPRIEFGVLAQAPTALSHTVPDRRVTPYAQVEAISQRVVVQGDYRVPARAEFERHLVVQGDLWVEEGAHLRGNVKARGEIHLADGVRADGSLVCGGALVVGSGCRVCGPVISERDVFLLPRSVVGTRTAQTTISAPCIWIEPGVTVFGSVWPRDIGAVGPFF